MNKKPSACRKPDAIISKSVVTSGDSVRGRLHSAFFVTTLLYDKWFVAEACDIGARQGDFPT
jgi:hypothetical protein